MKHYERRVVLIDLDTVSRSFEIEKKLWDLREYRLVSVNQHYKKLIYTFEKENEEETEEDI